MTFLSTYAVADYVGIFTISNCVSLNNQQSIRGFAEHDINQPTYVCVAVSLLERTSSLT